MVPGTPHPGNLHSLQCSRQKVRQAPQTLIPPPPLGLATVFYAGHQGPKCAQHALSRRSNGKGVGEGGTSTPRWGAPTLHARTKRTKLSFPLQCIDRWQQVVNTLGCICRRTECLWFYRNLTDRSKTCCLDDLPFASLWILLSPFCPLWDCFLYRVHFSTFCFFHLKFLLLISLIWHTMTISRLLIPFYHSGKQRFCDWKIVGVWLNVQCSTSHKQAIIANLCTC